MYIQSCEHKQPTWVLREYFATAFNINNKKTYYIKHKPSQFYAKARTTLNRATQTNTKIVRLSFENAPGHLM